MTIEATFMPNPTAVTMIAARPSRSPQPAPAGSGAKRPSRSVASGPPSLVMTATAPAVRARVVAAAAAVLALGACRVASSAAWQASAVT